MNSDDLIWQWFHSFSFPNRQRMCSTRLEALKQWPRKCQPKLTQVVQREKKPSSDQTNKYPLEYSLYLPRILTQSIFHMGKHYALERFP